MKFYLVDKYDNINTTGVLDSGVGLSGARTYFLGIKKLDEKKFDKLWRVMTEEQWNLQFKVSLQNRQSGKRKVNGGRKTKRLIKMKIIYWDESCQKIKKGLQITHRSRFLKL